MTSKKRFTVYGNCQAVAIAAQMLAYPRFAASYEYVPLDPCFLISEEAIQQWVQQHRGSLDLVISHNLNAGWRGSPAWDVATVAQALKPQGQLLRYTDIYFRGVNPLLAYPKTFPRPAHCDYVDLVSLTLAANGFAHPGLCAGVYHEPTLLDPHETEGLLDLAESELLRREAGLEIQIAREAALLCRRTPAFHTFNHPTNQALNLVAQAAFKAMGQPDTQLQWPASELLYTVRFPLPNGLHRAYLARGADAASLPDPATVRLERGELVELEAYFALALQALTQYTPQQLLQELELQRRDPVSGTIIRAIERNLCNRLAISPAVLAEVARLNTAGITPDFLLNKADPQAVGFMVDLLGAIRNAVLPRLTGDRFTVLDLGAKSGAGSELMAYLGQTGTFSKVKFEVTCADIDPTFAPYCAVKHPHVEYLNADAFAAGRQWDIVICSHVVEHVPDPLAFVAKLREVARQFVVLAFPYVEDPARLIPGHLHSLGHDFLRAVQPSRYEIYDGLFWSQSMCCIAILDLRR